MTLARVLAGRGDPLGCASELHQVPDWYPYEGRCASPSCARGRVVFLLDAPRRPCWPGGRRSNEDPLQPVAPDVYYDACQELLKLYAIE